MPNGCGMFGGVSAAWKLATGAFPPFEACCDEHDLAYEQAPDEAGRKWADEHFLRCMAGRDWPRLGWVFFVVVRYFGWVAALRHRAIGTSNHTGSRL